MNLIYIYMICIQFMYRTRQLYISIVCNSQVLAALSVSLGSLVVGFSSGYTSPALPSMKNPNITDFVVTETAVGVCLIRNIFFASSISDNNRFNSFIFFNRDHG